jgi:hypothetical protein
VAKSFEFPQLTKPGVYVIDFIGSGKSSRALIRKGRLKPLVATGTAGQNITVVDEANKPVPEAIVWLSGVEYKCDKEGKTTLPFSAQPGRRPVVISRGEFACVDTIEHQPENYRSPRASTSTARAVTQRPGAIDRAAALPQRPARLGEDPRRSALRIVSVDQNGIASTEVPTSLHSRIMSRRTISARRAGCKPV